MRIAHIDTEKGWRGGEQQLLSLCEALQDKGHHNWIISRRDSALSKRLWEKRMTYTEVRPFGEWDVLTAATLRCQLNREKIQIVHAHTAHGVALGALSTWGTSIPVIATRRVDFHLRKNLCSQWKYRRTGKIIAVSQGVKAILMQDGIPVEKIDVVHDGIDFGRFKSVVPVTKEKLGLPENCVLIGQIAALVPHKNPLNFLKALTFLRREISNIRALLIGEGELKDFLEKKVDELDLRSIVQFLGFKKDPLNYLAGFDIFCLSSAEEGLGTSILDAMALRVPVVATDAGGIPELVEHRQTGYLARARSPESLAKMLSLASCERQRNKRILDQAYKKCQQFNIDLKTSEIELLYLSAIEAARNDSAVSVERWRRKVSQSGYPAWLTNVSRWALSVLNVLLFLAFFHLEFMRTDAQSSTKEVSMNIANLLVDNFSDQSFQFSKMDLSDGIQTAELLEAKENL